MRPGLLFLLALASMPLAGWPLLAHPAYRRFSRTCRLVLSGAVGAVLISGWMTVFALVNVSWRSWLLLVAAAATSFALRPLLRGEGPADRPAPEPAAAGLAEGAAIALAALAVLWASLATISGAASSVDLLYFWGPKAQAFASASTIDEAFLRHPFHDHLHAHYPPLVTNLYAFGAMAAGRFPWGAATLTFPLALASIAAGLPGLLRSTAPRRLSLAASALVVSGLGFVGARVFVAGNGEPPLWVFEIFAVALLISPAAESRSGQLLAGLMLAGAAAAKVEGLSFVIAAAVLFLLLRRRQLPLVRTSLFLILPAALSLAAWFAFGASRHLFLGYKGYGSFWKIDAGLLGPVLAGIAGAFWSAGFALPFVLPLLAFLAAPRKSAMALLSAGVSLGLSCFFVFTYLHGDPNVAAWITWSAGRIFSALPAFLAIGSLARQADA